MAHRKPRVSHAAGYQTKKLRVLVEAQRDINPTTGKPQFIACAYVGGAGHLYAKGVTHRGGHRGSPYQCAPGKNPRRAISNALRQLAARVQSRSGAFAGVR